MAHCAREGYSSAIGRSAHYEQIPGIEELVEYGAISCREKNSRREVVVASHVAGFWPARDSTEASLQDLLDLLAAILARQLYSLVLLIPACTRRQKLSSILVRWISPLPSRSSLSRDRRLLISLAALHKIRHWVSFFVYIYLDCWHIELRYPHYEAPDIPPILPRGRRGSISD